MTSDLWERGRICRGNMCVRELSLAIEWSRTEGYIWFLCKTDMLAPSSSKAWMQDCGPRYHNRALTLGPCLLHRPVLHTSLRRSRGKTKEGTSASIHHPTFESLSGRTRHSCGRDCRETANWPSQEVRDQQCQQYRTLALLI